MTKIITLLFVFSFSSFAGFLPSTFKSDIVQSYKSQIKGKIRKSTGYIEYKYPGNLILSVKGKNNFTLVMKKKTSWYYQPPFLDGMKGEVSVGSTKSSPLYESLNLLKNGLETNKFYTVKTLKKSNHLVILQKKQKQFGIKEIRLHFNDSKNRVFKNIDFMELFPLNQEKVTINFKNMNDRVKFSNKHFVFKIPNNTNVNGQTLEKGKRVK